MLDHYTLPELAFKLNVHKKDLYRLAALGPGFEIVRLYPTTAPRYAVKKSDIYSWMACVRRDMSLLYAAKKIAPYIQFWTLVAERNKWQEDLKRIYRIYRRKDHG